MLHEPSNKFEPSSAAPAFDPKAYVVHMRKSGMIIYPVIMPSDRRTFGLTTPGQTGFGRKSMEAEKRHRAAYDADPNASRRVFDALCEDLGVDPADPNFNHHVNAICAHEDIIRQGDKHLMARCRAATRLLEKDLAATNLLCDVTAKYEALKPDRPTVPNLNMNVAIDEGDSAAMKQKLPGIAECNSKAVVDAYRTRIAAVVAWEKECARLDREIGYSRADIAASIASNRATTIVEEIACITAKTLVGMAAKASLLLLWKKAGYGLHDSGEELALSIAEDARMLGTGDALRSRPASPAGRPRKEAYEPSAQVQH